LPFHFNRGFVSLFSVSFLPSVLHPFFLSIGTLPFEFFLVLFYHYTLLLVSPEFLFLYSLFLFSGRTFPRVGVILPRAGFPLCFLFFFSFQDHCFCPTPVPSCCPPLLFCALLVPTQSGYGSLQSPKPFPMLCRDMTLLSQFFLLNRSGIVCPGFPPANAVWVVRPLQRGV